MAKDVELEEANTSGGEVILSGAALSIFRGIKCLVPDLAIGGGFDAILHPIATMLPIDFSTTEDGWFFKLEQDPGGFVARAGTPAGVGVVV